MIPTVTTTTRGCFTTLDDIEEETPKKVVNMFPKKRSKYVGMLLKKFNKLEKIFLVNRNLCIGKLFLYICREIMAFEDY